MIWPRHPIYMITHILIGIIGYSFPALLIAFLAYQFIQYIFGVRFFLFEMTIKSQNSLEHTSYKIIEAFIGYISTMLYMKYGGVNMSRNFVTTASIDG